VEQTVIRLGIFDDVSMNRSRVDDCRIGEYTVEAGFLHDFVFRGHSDTRFHPEYYLAAKAILQQRVSIFLPFFCVLLVENPSPYQCTVIGIYSRLLFDTCHADAPILKGHVSARIQTSCEAKMS
jgi:hypothetical protein